MVHCCNCRRTQQYAVQLRSRRPNIRQNLNITYAFHILQHVQCCPLCIASVADSETAAVGCLLLPRHLFDFGLLLYGTSSSKYAERAVYACLRGLSVLLHTLLPGDGCAAVVPWLQKRRIQHRQC
jgi:hypothetical protein